MRLWLRLILLGTYVAQLEKLLIIEDTERLAVHDEQSRRYLLLIILRVELELVYLLGGKLWVL